MGFEEVPCIECGSMPEEYEFYITCTNEKCPMHVRAVIAECWPQSLADWNKEAKKNPTQIEE